MPDSPPLIILCPPRSFSSVVCAMLGQHPDMYGFPELHLFVAETVAGLRELLRRDSHGAIDTPLGLLRALAQLHGGVQSVETVEQARAWLDARQDWSTRAVFAHLLELIRPRMGVEKSPQTTCSLTYLRRARAACPAARFLHLTRHPATAVRSMEGHFRQYFPPETATPEACAWRWLLLHHNILEFFDEVRTDQRMRIRGEDLLADPGAHLTRIAAWVGVRTDREAVEAMLRPEASPYAGRGPENAPFGSDPNWMEAPHLRSLADPLPPLRTVRELALEQRLAENVRRCAAELGY